LKSFLKKLDEISEWSGKIVSFIMIPLILIICYDVFMRYVLNKPTEWADELSCFLFGIMWLVGGAYTYLTNSLVRMDVIYLRFSPKRQAIIDLCTSPFFFAFAIVVLWQGTIMAAESFAKFEKSWSMWGPYIYFLKVFVPLGALLILIQGIAKFLRNLASVMGWKVAA
jgi:TRAP-type mannitol/chloroaromatic compound transport system permease small subunit